MRIFMLLFVAACASHPAADAPSEQRMFTMPGEARVAGAECPLKLELSAPLPPLVAGREVTIPIVVRNASTRRVQSCVIDGVSVRIRSEADGQWRFVVVHGATTDTQLLARDPAASRRDGKLRTQDLDRFPPGARDARRHPRLRPRRVRP